MKPIMTVSEAMNGGRKLADSNFSRKVNSRQELPPWEYFLIGVATTQAEFKARAKK